MKSKKQLKSLFILLSLLFLFLSPLILAIILYVKQPIYLQHKTTNRGQLIDSLANFNALDKTTLYSPPDMLAKQKKYWLLFYLASAPCKDLCQKNLHLMHQINLALGKNSAQEKYALLQVRHSKGLIETGRMQADPHLLNYFISDKEFHKFFSKFIFKKNAKGYYLVDPLGRIILYYPPHARGEDIYQDLSHLLAHLTTG